MVSSFVVKINVFSLENYCIKETLTERNEPAYYVVKQSLYTTLCGKPISILLDKVWGCPERSH